MIDRLSLDSSLMNDSCAVDLARAYARCADITRYYSKSFYFSTTFLPPAIRRAIRAFYAFCRTTDDLIDVPVRPENIQATINEWRVNARQSSHNQQDPVLYAWADTRERYHVPQEYTEELIDGCEMDLHISRYETYDELRHYCYRVASTVGLVSMHIIGLERNDSASCARAQQCAIDLGIALQLTNILRDVGEDLARGRVYLPQEELRRFSYTEEDLRANVIDNRFRSFMRFQIERAQRIYKQNWQGIAYLRSEGRLAVGAAISLYRGILDRIVQSDFNVFTRRAHLTIFDKLKRMPSIYLRARRCGKFIAE